MRTTTSLSTFILLGLSLVTEVHSSPAITTSNTFTTSVVRTSSIAPTSTLRATTSLTPTATQSSTVTSSVSVCNLPTTSSSSFDITVTTGQSYPTATPTNGDSQAEILYDIGQSGCTPQGNDTVGFQNCVTGYVNSLNLKRDMEPRGTNTTEVDVDCTLVCCIKILGVPLFYLHCVVKYKKITCSH